MEVRRVMKRNVSSLTMGHQGGGSIPARHSVASGTNDHGEMMLSNPIPRIADPRRSGPDILPGVSALHGPDHSRRRRLLAGTLGFAMAWLTGGCSHSTPGAMTSRETSRGEIQYTLHSPKLPARHHVILAHGFLRSPQNMHHLARALADEGIETACIALRRSKPWAGSHAENASDIVALRKSLGWKDVAYAGFSAGGLSALIAASEDPACDELLLLDPVDHASLGKDAASKIRIRTLAILGRPGPGNANRNAWAMLAAIPGCRIVEIPNATHCDFEDRPSALCHLLTGSRPDATRTVTIHEILLRESCLFLKGKPVNPMKNPPSP